MISAIEKRKSIRKFQNKKVEPEKVESILRAAMRAPSARMGFPWEFIVVDDPNVLEKLQDFSIGAHAMPTAPMVIITLYKELPERMSESTYLVNYEDMGACCENLWLQAVEEGLGVSWMGVRPGTKSIDIITELFHLPPDIKPFNVMAVGYAAEDVDTTVEDRFDPNRIHYNTY